MGVLDDVLKGTLTQPEALAGIAVAASISDKHISNEEAISLQASLLRMRLFKDWTEERFSSMFNKLADIVEKQGINELLKMSVDSLAQEFHETAFVIATDLVLADGTIADQEKAFLYELQRLLKIDDHLARKIVEVMVIKNKG